MILQDVVDVAFSGKGFQASEKKKYPWEII